MSVMRLIAAAKLAALGFAALGFAVLAAGPALAQQGGPQPRPFDGRYEIRTDVYFYDTDILREAHAREPYRTTIMVDRVTGQTWVLLKVGESRVVWSAVEFRTSDGKTVPRPQ